MFPTFTHLISRHPRRFSLLGLSFFVLGTLLWYVSDTPVKVVQVTQDNQSEHTEVDALQEQFAMLDSLKNKEPDTMSDEEKIEMLAQLRKGATSSLSVAEQKQLLEKLK